MSDSVFITGGFGLLGLSWALAMRDRYAVTLGVHERQIGLSRVATHCSSLETVDAVSRALEKIQPTVVVHAAGLANVEQCEADPALAQFVNVELSANVAEACARSGVRLVHISTDHLFRGDVALAGEHDALDPQNTYGRTKAEAEGRVLAAHPDALVVRTNFYGWGPPYRASFSDWIIGALRAGTPITLFTDVFYTPILAEALSRTAHDLVARQITGIVHIAGDERITKYEFGLQVAARFGLDAGLIRAGTLAEQSSLVRRPHDMSLSNALVRRVLGRPLGGPAVHLGRLLAQEALGHGQELRER